MNPKSFEEVTDRILSGDWERFDTEDEDFYYLVGAEAYRSEFEKGRAMGSAGWTIAERGPERPPPQLEKYTRALLASHQPDFVQAAEKRLKRSGIGTDFAMEILSIVGSEERSREERIKDALRGRSPEQLDALVNYVQALMAQQADVSSVTHAEGPSELRVSLQKFYLYELSRKYEKILSRAERLSPLPFEDPQLEEATRCWLYGFYRASIVLSACALEAILKSVAGVDRFDKYEELLNLARMQGILTGPYAESAWKVFSVRNRVVHKASSPGADEAEEVLALARGAIAEIRENAGAQTR